MTDPLVSITLTSYNQKEKLKRALDSLLNQTYKQIEIIIVDDYSTDGSQDFILEQVSKRPGIVRYYFQSRNVGIPKNKNSGFKLSEGEFLTYLDGDDYYLPEKIENEVRYFQKNPECDVVFSDFIIKNSSEEKPWSLHQDNLPLNLFHKIFSRDFPRNTVFRFELMKHEVLKRIEYYDETLPAFHDWDSRIRYSSFAKIGYCKNVGSVYYTSEEGISRRLSDFRLFKEQERIYIKNKHLLNRLSRHEKREIRYQWENFFYSGNKEFSKHTSWPYQFAKAIYNKCRFPYARV